MGEICTPFVVTLPDRTIELLNSLCEQSRRAGGTPNRSIMIRIAIERMAREEKAHRRAAIIAAKEEKLSYEQS